jgi:hypothetical protein
MERNITGKAGLRSRLKNTEPETSRSGTFLVHPRLNLGNSGLIGVKIGVRQEFGFINGV